MRSLVTYSAVWRRKSAPLADSTLPYSRSLLAGQAVQHFQRFLTRNRRDFEDIPGLDLVLYQLPIRTSTSDR